MPRNSVERVCKMGRKEKMGYFRLRIKLNVQSSLYTEIQKEILQSLIIKSNS